MSDAALDALRRQVEALAERVRRLEDEFAVHRLIVRYGFAVDTGDADGAADVFAEDAVYDVDGPLLMQGRQGVRDMVRGPRHQGMLPNCAHQIGPAVVEVDGDRARATGYSRVYVKRDGGIEIYRVSFNRWELERDGGDWRIVRRTTRLLGHAEAQALLRRRPTTATP